MTCLNHPAGKQQRWHEYWHMHVEGTLCTSDSWLLVLLVPHYPLLHLYPRTIPVLILLYVPAACGAVLHSLLFEAPSLGFQGSIFPRIATYFTPSLYSSLSLSLFLYPYFWLSIPTFQPLFLCLCPFVFISCSYFSVCSSVPIAIFIYLFPLKNFILFLCPHLPVFSFGLSGQFRLKLVW